MGNFLLDLFIDISALPYDFYGWVQIIFHFVVYFYIYFKSIYLINWGSNLFLLRPKWVTFYGSVMIPFISSTPDFLVILCSCFGESSEARDYISMGVGSISGQVIMAVTIPWAIIILTGGERLPYEHLSKRTKEGKTKKRTIWNRIYTHLFDEGIVVTDIVQKNIYFIVISMIPLVIVTISSFIYGCQEEGVECDPNQRYFILVAFILCCINFVAYFAVEYFIFGHNENKIVHREEVMFHSIQKGVISLSELFTEQIMSLSLEEQENGGDEYEAIYTSIQRVAKKFFSNYDITGCGRINREEMAFLLRDLGDPLTGEELQHLYDQYDLNSDGYFSFEEFCLMVFDMCENKLMTCVTSNNEQPFLADSYTGHSTHPNRPASLRVHRHSSTHSQRNEYDSAAMARQHEMNGSINIESSNQFLQTNKNFQRLEDQYDDENSSNYTIEQASINKRTFDNPMSLGSSYGSDIISFVPRQNSTAVQSDSEEDSDVPLSKEHSSMTLKSKEETSPRSYRTIPSPLSETVEDHSKEDSTTKKETPALQPSRSSTHQRPVSGSFTHSQQDQASQIYDYVHSDSYYNDYAIDMDSVAIQDNTNTMRDRLLQSSSYVSESEEDQTIRLKRYNSTLNTNQIFHKSHSHLNIYKTNSEPSEGLHQRRTINITPPQDLDVNNEIEVNDDIFQQYKDPEAVKTHPTSFVTYNRNVVQQQEKHALNRSLIPKSYFYLFSGWIIMVFFCYPMVYAFCEITTRMNVPTFYVSFFFSPFIAYLRDFNDYRVFAKRQTIRVNTSSIALVQGMMIINNIMNIGLFLGTVYFRHLDWNYTSEMIGMLITEVACAFLSIFKVERKMYLFLVCDGMERPRLSYVFFVLFLISFYTIYYLEEMQYN